MTTVRIIKQKNASAQKRKHRRKSYCSCFGSTKSDSEDSLEGDLNEPYEYIVEKLVIKRVPAKQFSPATNLRNVKSISSNRGAKPIVTFSSYCQMKPSNVNSGVKPRKKKSVSLMDELSDGDKGNVLTADKILGDGKRDKPVVKEEVKPVSSEICGDGDGGIVGFDSPRDEMTSGRREQLQQCTKNLNTAQVYKHTTNSPKLNAKKIIPPDNNVLFTKPIPAREKGTKELPPAVKETIDILATKQPLSSVNRRLVTRDPDTGQIKEIFQNVKIEKPMRLDEIYTQQEEKVSKDKNRPKWKIIIRHRDEKLKQKFEESSSELGIDSDVYSNKNII